MRYPLCALVFAVVIFLTGCGGDSPAPGASSGVATIGGQLTNTANPTAFDIYVDGQRMSARPGQDGRFRIDNVPPGSHTVSFISQDGLEGAHFTCEVNAGGTAEIGEVPAVAGGQIVGMVMRLAEDGNLTPLSGIEVIADPDAYWVDSDDGPASGQEDGSGASPSQPRDGDLVQLRAFTDEQGSYTMQAVPAGSYVVTVNVPGLEQGVNWVWVEPGHTAVADFQLRELIEPGVGTVSGTVTAANDDGAGVPLEGASVVVSSDAAYWEPTPLYDDAAYEDAEPGIMPPPYYFEMFRTLTDAHGNYSLNVPAGYLYITVWADGYESVIERFVLHPREHLVKDFALRQFEGPVPETPEPL